MMNSGAPMCRYFLSGGCYRSDCMFSHEAQTCRFWLLGECLKGDACQFRHVVEPEPAPPAPPPPTVPASPAPQPAPAERADTRALLLDDPMIPDHHRIPAAVAAPAQRRVPAHFPLSFADRLKLNQLTEKYAVLPATVVEDVFLCSANRNAGATEAIILQTYPHLASSDASPSPSPPPPSSSSSAGVAPPAKAKRKGKSIKWVETGHGLHELYTSLREQAIQHARLRNALFEQSTSAYLNGQKARATELSRLARSHDEQMVELHRQAADCIYNARNEGLAANVIDLHGLHVAEALPRLDAFLAKQHAAGQRDAYIITGTGHHSSLYGGKSRLLPAVHGHLQSAGYRFENSPTDKRGGTTRVMLR